jgi:hypothetical protein
MATFFATVDEFAGWLEKHGANQASFVVGITSEAQSAPA